MATDVLQGLTSTERSYQTARSSGILIGLMRPNGICKQDESFHHHCIVTNISLSNVACFHLLLKGGFTVWSENDERSKIFRSLKL